MKIKTIALQDQNDSIIFALFSACAYYVDYSDLLNKIRFGTKANVGEFPHMVALFQPSNEPGKNLSFICGGSIISELFILTAAHCANSRIASDNPTIARVGHVSKIVNKMENRQSNKWFFRLIFQRILRCLKTTTMRSRYVFL